MTLEVRSVSKQYELKSALKDVSVTFEAGKIHALVGDNGAGKSTLAAIISGAIQPTAGTLLADGEEVRFTAPRDALARGIVIVQQRPLLAPPLNAVENIRLQLTGALSHTRRGFFSAHAARKSIQNSLQKLEGLRDLWAPDLSLTTPVQYLGGARRFYIAFLGAMLLKPRFLILDEPSAFLDQDERKTLYTHLREAVASKDITVLVITHSGAEAETYADTVTHLRRGSLVAHYQNARDYHAVITPVQGEPAELLHPTATAMSRLTAPLPKGELCFALEHISARPKNKSALLDASLAVYYGEITAVTGLKEAALDTLEDVVTGMGGSSAHGKAQFAFRTLTETRELAHKPLTSRFLRTHHTAIVPSDRTFRASNPALTVEQMLSVHLTHEQHTSPRAFAEHLIELAGVQITPQELAKNLSGGMLQRLILTRELATNPDCIILCNPLQGLDKRGQRKMVAVAIQLAKQGKAVLIIGAADFPLTVCQHVYALESGVCSLSYSSQAHTGALS